MCENVASLDNLGVQWCVKGQLHWLPVRQRITVKLAMIPVIQMFHEFDTIVFQVNTHKVLRF